MTTHKSPAKQKKEHYKAIAKRCIDLYRKIKCYEAELQEIIDSNDLEEINKMIGFDINLLNQAVHDIVRIGQLAKRKSENK